MKRVALHETESLNEICTAMKCFQSTWDTARTIYHLNDYSVYFLAYIPFTEVMAINKDKVKLTWKRESQLLKAIEIKDMMLLHLTISLISSLLPLKTAASLRIYCATYIKQRGCCSSAAGCCAGSQASGTGQQQTSAKDSFQSRCPKQNWKSLLHRTTGHGRHSPPKE